MQLFRSLDFMLRYKHVRKDGWLVGWRKRFYFVLFLFCFFSFYLLFSLPRFALAKMVYCVLEFKLSLIIPGVYRIYEWVLFALLLNCVNVEKLIVKCAFIPFIASSNFYFAFRIDVTMIKLVKRTCHLCAGIWMRENCHNSGVILERISFLNESTLE